MLNLRVTLVTGTYSPAKCGVGDYTQLLSDALASRGADVSVITSSYIGVPYRSGNPDVLPIVDNWSLPNAWKVLRSILGTRPDIVHFQFPTSEYYSHRLFDLLVPIIRLWPKSIKIIVTLHESISVKKSIVPGLFRPLRHWLSCSWTDAIIVVAESSREQIVNLSSRVKRIPCQVIPIASNIPVSQLGSDQLSRLREQQGISKSDILLSYFGFIHPCKGFEHLIEVLKCLRGEGVPAKLIVLGELSDANPYHRQLLSSFADQNYEDCVRVMGHLTRNDVADLLAMSDACVLPFLDGVHPKRGSFLAAAQQGVLIVTTSNEKSGLSSTENVFYARPGDITGMASAIQKFATRRLPPRISSWRSWASVADEHLQFFRQILDSGEATHSMPTVEQGNRLS